MTYREVVTLPAKPATWGDTEHLDWPQPIRPKTTISPDGRVSTTEEQLTLQTGQIIPSYVSEDGSVYILSPFPSAEWQIADGDPPGEWTIEAFVNEKRIAHASFHVARPR